MTKLHDVRNRVMPGQDLDPNVLAAALHGPSLIVKVVQIDLRNPLNLLREMQEIQTIAVDDFGAIQRMPPDTTNHIVPMHPRTTPAVLDLMVSNASNAVETIMSDLASTLRIRTNL